MNTYRFRFLCTLFILLCETAFAATPIDVSTASGQGDRLILDVLEVSTKTTVDSISPPDENAAWIKQKAPMRMVGFKTHGIWLRTSLSNSSFQTIHSYIKVGKPYMDKVDCFVNSADGEHQVYRMGDKTFFHSRPLPYKDSIIPIEMEAFSSKQLICFIKNNGATFADFQLWNPHAYQQAESLTSAFRSLNYGAIAVAAIAGIFLGI